MKITIVLGAFLPVPPIMGGAVEKAWFALAKEFVKRGHNVTLISRAMPQFAKSETTGGLQHVRIAGFDAPRSLARLKFLDLIYSMRALRALEPADILVTNTFWLPFLVRKSKLGHVYVHVARFPKGQMRMYKRAARLQAPSRAVADAIAAEVPQMKSRITVVPYSRPKASSDAAPPATAQRPKTILYVGRVHPEKGVHLLVEAFAGLTPEQRADWRLVIIGPADAEHGGGGAEYFEQLASAACADGQIELRGAVFDEQALEREYNQARVFVYPSLADRGESFGLAPLEAMTHRCAVLVSDLGCFRDFIIAGETGLVFNHHAPEPVTALREKLAELLTDAEAAGRLADDGWRKSAEYTLANVADRFLADFNLTLQQAHA